MTDDFRRRVTRKRGTDGDDFAAFGLLAMHQCAGVGRRLLPFAQVVTAGVGSVVLGQFVGFGGLEEL